MTYLERVLSLCTKCWKELTIKQTEMCKNDLYNKQDPELKKQPNIWTGSKPEMTPLKNKSKYIPCVCVCSSPVSHWVPEGEGRSGQLRLTDQKPLVLGEPARRVFSQPSVLGGRARWKGDGAREEPDESVYLQRRFVMFRLQGEFLQHTEHTSWKEWTCFVIFA